MLKKTALFLKDGFPNGDDDDDGGGSGGGVMVMVILILMMRTLNVLSRAERLGE